AVAEQFADGHVSEQDLDAAMDGAVQFELEIQEDEGSVTWEALCAVMECGATLGFEPERVCEKAFDALREREAVRAREAGCDVLALVFERKQAAMKAEFAPQVELVRHIVGNPFRPYPAPLSWPSTVVQLAESLYDGQDCAFALHDALLEAGHVELAEHFRQETWHPKGCWALDVILGKV